MHDDDVVAIMRDPLIGVGSDNGAPLGDATPADVGMLPRVLRAVRARTRRHRRGRKRSGRPRRATARPVRPGAPRHAAARFDRRHLRLRSRDDRASGQLHRARRHPGGDRTGGARRDGRRRSRRLQRVSVRATYSGRDRAEGVVMATTPLRVAMLAPISWRVPPRHYGPWEQFVSLLTEGLVERGRGRHVVRRRRLASRPRPLVGTIPTGYSEDPELDAKVWEGLHIATVFERAAEFDLIHNNFDFLPLTYSGLVDTPVVTTIHGFSSEKIVPVFERYDDRGHYVAISDADRHPRLHYEATIHHGIRMDDVPARADRRGTTCCSSGASIRTRGGRGDRRRRARRACRSSSPASSRTRSTSSVPWSRASTATACGTSVPSGPTERGAVLGGARALLHLISFDEPFGFSVIESMACGTPVIATRRGSMPELVQHGVNGCPGGCAGRGGARRSRRWAGSNGPPCARRWSDGSTWRGWSTTTSTSTDGSPGGGHSP